MAGIPHFDPIEAEVEGHTLSLFISGKDRLAALIEIIDGAKESLRLFFYIYGDDLAAQRVTEALLAARARGVNVWLLVDGFGSGDRNDDAYAKIVEAGIVFCRFYPRYGRRYLLRNHQKIVIADGDVALIGGANVVENYFTDDPEGKSWHDLFLRVQGPSAKRLCVYYDALRRWMLSERPHLRGLKHILARKSEKKGAPLRWLFSGPFRTISPLTRQIVLDLDHAKRLDTIQAYFSPNWAMLRRIGRIVRRGGEARIMTAQRSDNSITIPAARHTYRRLLKRGVRIFEYSPQMLHAKLLVIDDVTYIGSANFDMRSLYINAEIMLRIESAEFADKMRALVAAHEPWCEEVTRAVHRKRSTPLARLRWLISYFIVAGVDHTVTRRLSLRRA